MVQAVQAPAKDGAGDPAYCPQASPGYPAYRGRVRHVLRTESMKCVSSGDARESWSLCHRRRDIRAATRPKSLCSWGIWTRRDGRGVFFGPSAGFTLSNGRDALPRRFLDSQDVACRVDPGGRESLHAHMPGFCCGSALDYGQAENSPG